ncbi:DUF1003 domain-containing protein [Methylomonas sp. HYX-M1]|uniref:DUF1003 domain-containing protein n=1 Tax=Methylomonas sp. HYX-M1 TaxID=3139307 RepID=UPI00345B5A82
MRNQSTPQLDTEANRAASIKCPACGGENPADVVFCLNHACHKALGEFRYALEELAADKTWLERLADRVAAFVSRPLFIVLHLLWFSLWIGLNESDSPLLGRFDSFPYDLLSIVLAIEAVLITGFLLISQNHQFNYSEKRAELDYEVSVRCYRKLLELERRLQNLSAVGENEQG